MTAIDALVFDLGNVIVRHDNRVLYERLKSRCAEPWTVEQIGVLAERPDWGTGAPIGDLHREIRASAGYSGDWAQFAQDGAATSSSTLRFWTWWSNSPRAIG